MSVKRKKLYLSHSLPPSLPKKVNRYRNINNSTSYIPASYNQKQSTSQKNNIVIVDEQDGSSSWL